MTATRTATADIIRGAKAPDSSLRRIRKRRGMTLEVLADLAGVSKGFVSKIENGGQIRRIDHLIAFASVLQVDPAELIVDEAAAMGLHIPLENRQAGAFAPIRDNVTVSRHLNLARELRGHIARGDARAAGMWLRRTARNPGVDPWLLIDRFVAREIEALRSARRDSKTEAEAG
jgi:transcriptional regulator with XRE-family HTH domain